MNPDTAHLIPPNPDMLPRLSNIRIEVLDEDPTLNVKQKRRAEREAIRERARKEEKRRRIVAEKSRRRNRE